MTTKKMSLVLGALALALVAAASVAYAGSALQLYASSGLEYVKHVTFNAGTSAQTVVTIRNLSYRETLVQLKVGARAVDGSNVSQTKTLSLRGYETRTVPFVWSKNITDLNFIQLIRLRVEQCQSEGCNGG